MHRRSQCESYLVRVLFTAIGIVSYLACVLAGFRGPRTHFQAPLFAARSGHGRGDRALRSAHRDAAACEL